MFSKLTSRRLRSVRAARDGFEVLEGRALMSTLAIEAIYRTTSVTPLDHQVRDQVPLDAAGKGSTTSLVGYAVPSDPAVPASPPLVFGGTGFEVDFTNTTGTSATVTIQWGKQEGSASGLQRDSAATTSVTIPHVYLVPDTYDVTITVSAGGQSVSAEVDTTISHVLAESQGIYIVGSQQADQVALDQQANGSVVFTSALEPSLGKPISLGRAPSVYVETLDGNDVVTATPRFRSSLWVDAGAGNDVVRGGSGNDHLGGGPGNDLIDAGAGNDFLYGGSGNDRLSAGPGNDVSYGGSGADVIVGGAGTNQIFGDAGDDTLIAGSGPTFLLGGLGSDRVYGGRGRDILAGGYDNAGYESQPQVVSGILAAWAHGNRGAAVRPLAGSNLFGANVANDGATDWLIGGGGRSLIVAHIIAGQANNDVVKLRRQDWLLRLRDLPVPTVNVQAVTTYTSTSGADIIGNPTHTTAVLGRNNPDQSHIIAALNFPLIQPEQFNRYYDVPRPGTLQLLNVNVTSLDTFWVDFNRPYLNDEMSVGSFFIMSSNPFDPVNRTNASGPFTGDRTFTSREVDYLLGSYEPGLRPAILPKYTYDPMRDTFTMKA